MKDGFIKAAAAAIDVRVADCIHNTDEIIKKARELSQRGARILVFPELSITGYTCQRQGAAFKSGRGIKRCARTDLCGSALCISWEAL